MAAAAAREQPVGRVAVVMMVAVTLAPTALAVLGSVGIASPFAVATASSFAPAPLCGKVGAS
jgi:hypothetical protein